MNWRRGTFRLWLVLSGLWIAGAIQYYHLISLESLRQGGRIAMCGPLVGDESLGWHCARGWHSDSSGRFEVVPIEEAIGWLVGPPVVTLLLGLGLVWIGRGFRSKA
jgi:hypothetical protein